MGSRIAALLLSALLTACASSPIKQIELGTKYEHHSSIPDFFDRNTADMVALPYVEFTVGRKCGDYCPVIGGAVNFEVTKNPVFGRDPSGELYIKMPLKKWHFD